MVREQLPDHVDEVGLASPGRTDDDDEQLDVLRGSEHVGVDDVEQLSFRCIANKERERVGGRMAEDAFVAGSHRKRASKSTPCRELGHMQMTSTRATPARGDITPSTPGAHELLVL